MRTWIYGVGCPEGNEDIYLNRYEQHNQEVIDYFRDRPDDLLILDLAKGDGWEQLCAFLGADIPNEPFPHANKARNRGTANSKSAKLLSKARALARSITSRFT
jgi:hypothetical protein